MVVESGLGTMMGGLVAVAGGLYAVRRQRHADDERGRRDAIDDGVGALLAAASAFSHTAQLWTAVRRVPFFRVFAVVPLTNQMGRQLQDLVKAHTKIALNVREEEVMQVAEQLLDLLAEADGRLKRRRRFRSQSSEWAAILDEIHDMSERLRAAARRDRALPALARSR